MCRQLMLALYRCGRQADALRVYRRAQTALTEKLGLNPSRELRELELAILAHDPTLTVAGAWVGDDRPATLSILKSERPSSPGGEPIRPVWRAEIASPGGADDWPETRPAPDRYSTLAS